MLQESSIIATHGEDVDGIVAAAMLKRHTNIEKTYFIQHSKYLETFTKIAKNNHYSKNLFVLDVPIRLNILDKHSYTKTILKKYNIYLIDHHIGSFNNKNELTNRGVNLCHHHCRNSIDKTENTTWNIWQRDVLQENSEKQTTSARWPPRFVLNKQNFARAHFSPWMEARVGISLQQIGEYN